MDKVYTGEGPPNRDRGAVNTSWTGRSVVNFLRRHTYICGVRDGDKPIATVSVERWPRRFVAYPSEQAAIAHALWLAHTHLMQCWHTTPRLAFMSAEKATGKTRALERSELLAPGPAFLINMSPAALVPLVDEGDVTVLFDEINAICHVI